ncbi:tyrosine-type recombinase/integrase [Enterococcus sp. HY326]|uniref:tyrosine-type recombinase/integrase n=1 Tax=Enterococcus sp. HY326 TaxID=2971265 RepID=UPI00223EDCB2|nr:site-specific integrase [Enterococcus sp. HY326]
MAVRRDKKTNKWIIDISTKNQITGKRKRIVRKNFDSKKTALEEESRLRELIVKEEEQAGMDFEFFYELLLYGDKLSGKKESHVVSQQYVFDVHLKNYFKHAKISKLNDQDIIGFRNSLLKKKLSNNYINKIVILLKKILDIAVRKKVLRQNPCTFLKRLPVEKEKMNFWTFDEFSKFDALFNGEEQLLRLFFHLAYFTGMRMGEILALSWEDIDFEKNQIYVIQSVTKIHGKEMISAPKTAASKRSISIHAQLSDLLLEWKNYQNDMLGHYASGRTDLDIRLFEDAPCHIMDGNSIRKKYDSILKRDCSLKRIRIHDFRHSHAALLVEQNQEPYIIKERLGHASIQTTYDVYGHLYPNKQQEIADRIGLLY